MKRVITIGNTRKTNFLAMLMAFAHASSANTPAGEHIPLSSVKTSPENYIPFTGNGSNGSYSYTKGSAKRQQRQSRRKRNIRLHPHSTARR